MFGDDRAFLPADEVWVGVRVEMPIKQYNPPLRLSVGSENLKYLWKFPEILPVNQAKSCPGIVGELKLIG